MGSSLAWVSAHSASGSEPATMPAPATSRARAPSISAPRSAIAHSPSPAGVDPADRAGVAPAVEALELADERRAAARRRRAADRGRRVQEPGQLERARRRRAQMPADRRGEVGDVPEHRDLGDGADVELACTRGASASTIASTTKRCSRCVLHRRRERAQRRRVAVGDRGARHRARLDDGRRRAGRGARGSRRRSRRSRTRSCPAAGWRGGATIARDVERAVGLDEHLAGEHDLLERRRRAMASSARSTIVRHCSGVRGASTTKRVGGAARRGASRAAGAISVDPRTVRPTAVTTTRGDRRARRARRDRTGSAPTAIGPVPGSVDRVVGPRSPPSAAATSSAATRAATPDGDDAGAVRAARRSRRGRSASSRSSRVVDLAGRRRRAGSDVGAVVMRASPTSRSTEPPVRRRTSHVGEPGGAERCRRARRAGGGRRSTSGGSGTPRRRARAPARAAGPRRGTTPRSRRA